MCTQTIKVLAVTLILCGALSAQSGPADSRLSAARGLHHVESAAPLTREAVLSAMAGNLPVGAAAPNGANSRGALIAQTYWDILENCSVGRQVAVNPVAAGTPGVHFTYPLWLGTGYEITWGYSCYDPTTGTYPYPGGTSVVQGNGWPYSPYGLYSKIVVDPEGGKAIIGGQDWDQNRGTRLHVSFQAWPLSGQFGSTDNGSVMPSDVNADQSIYGEYAYWPKMAMTVTSTDTVIYLACNGDRYPYLQSIKLFRKVGKWQPDQGYFDYSWQVVFVDTSFNTTQDIAVDPTSTKVAISWTKYVNGDASGNSGYDVWYAVSPTGVVGSFVRNNLTHNDLSVDRHSAYCEAVPYYDSQGKLHIIWNTALDGKYDQSKIYHWSENEPSRKYLVYDATWDPGGTCGGGGYNVSNVGKLTIAECDSRLYIAFCSWNDPLSGHVDDCAWENWPWMHRGNGEVYVTISKDLFGKSWDVPRNLTNSYTPGCPTIYYDCNSDIDPNFAISPIDDADFYGYEYWGQAYTYDPSGGAYTGSKYLHLSYLLDFYPSRRVSGWGYWTLNQLKWIRLACVQPVTAARLDVSPSQIAYPEFTKPNTAKNYTLELANVGNTLLTFTGVTMFEDSSKGIGAPASGWLDYSGLPSTLMEEETRQMTLTLNKGGVVPLGPTVLYGRLRFAFSTPAQTLDLPIVFAVADTVVAITFDTISTSCTNLGVASNGNMGLNRVGRVNMDYAALDCDSGANSRGNSAIYLSDGSPVIIRKLAPWSYRGSWSAFKEFNPNYAPQYAFKPVTGPWYAPHGLFVSASYYGFNSGTFVTSDSLVKVEKTWWAPRHPDSCNFIIERMRIFSATIGTPVSDLQIGEIVDFDVPSDTSSIGVIGEEFERNVDNESGTDATRRLVWQRGFNSADTVTDCVDNSKRYAGVALLNWHMKNRTCFDSLYGGRTIANDSNITYFPGLVPDSLSRLMNVSGYSTESRTTNITTLMTFKDGPDGYTLPANDTLTIYTALATVRTAASKWSGLDSLELAIDKAKNFMRKNLNVCASCCFGETGNVNGVGIVDLSDLSALVSYLTGGGFVIICAAEANINGLGIIDLSDLSALVSYLTGGGYVLPPCYA